MKRLNNKGITTIEVIVCFVLIVIITSSMYSTISSFNQKRLIEDYKSQIMTYKHLLTKEIQDDFIKVGLTHAKYTKEVINDGATTTYTLDCELRDGTNRRLKVTRTIAQSTYHIEGSTTLDDNYMIEYGPSDDMIEYPIPKLGESKNKYNHTVQDLSINNILMEIDDGNVLTVYIGFYHPELTTRYGITIICPVDYVTPGADGTNTLM